MISSSCLGGMTISTLFSPASEDVSSFTGLSLVCVSASIIWETLSSICGTGAGFCSVTSLTTTYSRTRISCISFRVTDVKYLWMNSQVSTPAETANQTSVRGSEITVCNPIARIYNATTPTQGTIKPRSTKVISCNKAVAPLSGFAR